MTHEELCERARRWLSGTRRCDPVFSNIASCSEIPDAIGWSSKWAWHGSTVVEVKASRSDFYADKKKYQYYAHPSDEPRINWMRHSVTRMSPQFAAEHGYLLMESPRMGDFRFFMCEPGVISDEMVAANAPDHGLLWVEGRRVRMVRDYGRRQAELINKNGEIRYLRFAIINGKKPFVFTEDEMPYGPEQENELRELRAQ